MSATKPAIDWERVELEYRAGILTLREIASLHGISHAAVNKRAKRDGWARDLKSKVLAKAEELVAKKLVSNKVSRQRADTEQQMVAELGGQLADVKLLHRSGIRRMREHTLRLLEEMEEVSGKRELFTTLGEQLRSENERGVDKLNDIYQAVISMAGRIDSTKKLAETLKTLVTLEREAFGLGDSDGGAPDTPAPTSSDPQAYYAWFTKQGAR